MDNDTTVERVFIPGPTKLHRLEENLGAAAIDLGPDDLREIEDAAAKILHRGQLLPGPARGNNRPLNPRRNGDRDMETTGYTALTCDSPLESFSFECESAWNRGSASNSVQAR